MNGISQFEKVLSLLYQNNNRCVSTVDAVIKREITPGEAAAQLFNGLIAEDLLCFLLMLSYGNELAMEVVGDLKKKKLGVDEAMLILKDEIEEECECLKASILTSKSCKCDDEMAA